MRVLLTARSTSFASSVDASLRAASRKGPFASRAGSVIAACLVALLMLGVSGCQEAAPTPDTPTGSLLMLADAAEKGEWGNMLVYMDPIQVGNSFAEATIARLDDEADPGASDGDSSSHSGGAFTASPMITGFTDAFMTNLRTNVENGTVVAEGNLLRVILDDGVGETQSVSENEARVTVEMPGDEGETIALRMVRDGDHWKLVSIEGTTDLYAVLF